MQSSNDSIHFAQAFHHGEPEKHSFVIAVGHLEAVRKIAAGEHARLRGAYGVAIYRTPVDADTQAHFRLVDYLPSDMGERWTCDQPPESAPAT